MGRECILACAAGKKSVGKSFQHVRLMEQYVKGDYQLGIRPRRCLIMDVNDEYGPGTYNIKSLSLKDVSLFTVHPKVEIRRIRPFHPNGQRMTLDEWSQALFYVLSRYQNGFLLIEDLNKFIMDQMPGDLIGAICTNRHIGLDIMLSYQSIGRINTKIWGNLSILRFHKNNESVERHKQKFPDKYEFMRIAEIMVNNEYARGNIRFFVYVDMDESKVRGDFNMSLIEEAISQYISENYNELLKPYIVQKDGKKRKYTDEQAIADIKEKLKKTYFE